MATRAFVYSRLSAACTRGLDLLTVARVLGSPQQRSCMASEWQDIFMGMWQSTLSVGHRQKPPTHHPSSSSRRPPSTTRRPRNPQDTGIKAIVSGLVIAQAQVLLASSLNHWSAKDIPGASVCQKPFSGYIELIAEWREELFRRPPETVVRMFPFGEVVKDPVATSTDSDNVVELDGEGAMIEVREDSEKRAEGKAAAAAGEDDGAGRDRGLGDAGQGATTAVVTRLLPHGGVLSTPVARTESVGQLVKTPSPRRR